MVEEQAKQDIRLKQSLVCCLLYADVLQGLFFDPKTRPRVPPKRRMTFNGLHGIIYQEIELFIIAAVRN
jgi:hypothetical protein